MTACKKPEMHEFVDTDGYTDFEAYDVVLGMWESDCAPPYLGYTWCGEQPEPTSCPVSFDTSTVELLKLLLEA